MDKNKELIADHLPLEEVMLADIDGIDSPENWTRSDTDESHELPPVLIEENRGFSLVGNHRTVWHLRNSGRTMVKCLVVRSTVHVRPAHTLISNSTEEAMLFDGLLRREIVPNRSRLADMLGYSRARITQLLNLLKLPMDIRQKVLVTDEISEFQLRQLLRVIDDETKLQAGFIKLMEKKLSGRQMAVFASKKETSDDPAILQEKEKDDNHSEEIKDIPEKKQSDSMAELEDVFAGEMAEDTQVEDDEDNTSGETRSTIEPDSSTRVDMATVLVELGNIRDDGWRIRASENMLSPLEMEFLEGVSMLRTGLYSEAIDILSEIVSRDSSFHIGWFYLGRCSNLTGALQEAEEYLRNAVSIFPENPDYLVELAVVLEKLKRHSEAEAFYRKSAIIRKALATGK